MNCKETKTGQSIDVVKASLINPALTKSILDIPELKRELSFIDIGSGDATSSRGVIDALGEAGYRVRDLALVDADIQIFPDLLETVTSEPAYSVNTQIFEAGKRDVLAEFLKHYIEQYDIALFQLVLHQIESDQRASYLMYFAYRALKPAGYLLVVNLHPKYLQYLAEHEPTKFVVTSRYSDGLVGKYHFDSGGSANVHGRSVETQLAMFLWLGFDLVKVIPIATTPLADQKPRYRDLARKGVPMFYIMQLKKNPANFISSTEGVVRSIRPYDPRWLAVTFADGEKIRIPMFSNWEKVNPNNHLILHETCRPEIAATLINYWIIDQEEEVTGGQLVARE